VRKPGWLPGFCSLSAYSIFDSALSRKLVAKWLFHQEKATLHDLQMATSESNMLWKALFSFPPFL
jgi:hypothetical protein